MARWSRRSFSDAYLRAPRFFFTVPRFLVETVRFFVAAARFFVEPARFFVDAPRFFVAVVRFFVAAFVRRFFAGIPLALALALPRFTSAARGVSLDSSEIGVDMKSLIASTTRSNGPLPFFGSCMVFSSVA
jgi:hypothetical protein